MVMDYIKQLKQKKISLVQKENQTIASVTYQNFLELMKN